MLWCFRNTGLYSEHERVKGNAIGVSSLCKVHDSGWLIVQQVCCTLSRVSSRIQHKGQRKLLDVSEVGSNLTRCWFAVVRFAIIVVIIIRIMTEKKLYWLQGLKLLEFIDVPSSCPSNSPDHFWFSSSVATAVEIRQADHVAPSIRKSWQSLRRQAAVARSV
jgi:hypothetical protein